MGVIVPASPPTPVPAPPAPVVAAAGHMTLSLQHIYGRPAFALTGESVVVRGVVAPYVPKQRLVVRFMRDGHEVSSLWASVLPLGNGAGQFHVKYASRTGGIEWATATHSASAQQAAYAAKSAQVRVLDPDMSEGASGPAVGVLQQQLSRLHYSVPTNGAYDEATGQAVVAFRKMTGLARVPTTDATVFHLLGRGAGQFHVRYPRDGRHVEADLTTQTLAEIEPGGRVRRIYTMSSGKPSTPTVIGRFRVYLKSPGTNSEGMVDSNYFIRGYAIHGYAEVPTYAASHGCLRVPIPDAPSIYAWVQVGTPVDVYNETGGGSKRVSGNAGP